MEQAVYLVLEITTMTAGACIPFINVIPVGGDAVWQQVASAALAAVVVFAAGISKLFKLQETWLRYRAIAALVDRVELLPADQTAQFLASQRTAREAPDAAGAETK